jgi:hypothetical protein
MEIRRRVIFSVGRGARSLLVVGLVLLLGLALAHPAVGAGTLSAADARLARKAFTL